MGNLEMDTVLHDAVRNGPFDIVELLIREHPRLTLLTNNAGESALFLAVDRAFYKIALHILEEEQYVLHVAVIGTGQGKSNKYSHVYQHFFFFYFALLMRFGSANYPCK